MAIVHAILGKADPQRMNGVNSVVHHLSCAQAQAGHRVEIWGITHSTGPASDYGRPLKTRLFRSRKARFALDPELLHQLDQLVQNQHHQGPSEETVLHLHGGFIPEWASLSRACRRRGIPYVFTAHGSYNVVAMDRSRRRKALYMLLFENRMLRGARAVHCIGRSELEALEARLPGLPTVLVPNGQAAVAASPEAKSKSTEPVFGFVGRLDRFTKGLDLLVDAFDAYRRRGGAGRLVLIGGGEDENRIRQDVRGRNLEAFVDFAGPRFGQEKLDLMAGFSAFFHPSRNEGMPTAVLEAAALGLPVVVSRETNTAEAVQAFGAGIALENNDARHLADAMVRVAQWHAHPELAHPICAAAQRMHREAFDWADIAQRLAAMAQQGPEAAQNGQHSYAGIGRPMRSRTDTPQSVETAFARRA